MSYAELLACSNFSFQRGASHPKEMVRRAKDLGYTAIAIVDECSLAGIVRAHEEALEANIPLIVGAQFRFAQEDRVALLAPTQAAYSQLCELITRARRASVKGSYKLTREDFTHSLDELIGLWLAGEVIEPEWARWFATLPLRARHLAFHHALAQDSAQRLDALRALGAELALPLVAVGDAHYHLRERRPLHDVLTAIRLKTCVDRIGRQGFANGERHLRPLTTLRRLYPPELLQASVDIAAACTFSLKSLHYEYPGELVPAGLSASQHLRSLTERGICRRWPRGVPDKVRTQIERELELIRELKYEHYFLTVEEIVTFARQQNILCQGRGSAANSAVCYALGVTAVNPDLVGMLFERFISRERHEPPDIDIDFEHQRREEVMQHIYEKYGRHRAALAATVITYRRRMAIRDVGRALGLPMDVVNTLSKSLLWFDRNGEIPEQLVRLGFDRNSPLVALLVALVAQLVGFPRHLSQHVGGFVISQHPLSTLVPVENAAMIDRTIIQWDKDDLESLGLLKVDCLALGMLSAIRRTLDLKSAFDGRPFRITDIPDGDAATYDMLCRGDTVGVFQVESRAQTTMLPRLKPRTYYDLVIQVAIVRPGPIQGGMVHPFLRRRQGLEKVDYPNPALEPVLARTSGVPLFQEQVMQLTMVAANFSADEADKVRRSMAAWQRRGGLEKFHDQLLTGMRKNGYSDTFAEQIYNQILGFGSYGFPESHAASFALLVYASAWLRCHEHPAFVAGLLNSWPMGFYAPAQLLNDARRNGVVFRPVDVRVSEWDCTLEANASGRPEVRLGLRLVSGLAKAQAAALLQARTAAPFADVQDLAHRGRLGRRTLQVLAQADALKGLSGHRHAAHWEVIGVEHLPGALAGASGRESPLSLPEPSEGQEIVADYHSTGLTIRRHPLVLLRNRLERLRVARAADLPRLPSGRPVRVAGIITHRQRPETASGVMFMSLEDETGVTNLIVWPSVQVEQRQAVFASSMIIVQGELQHEMGVVHVIAQRVRDYSAWLGSLATHSRDFR
ncbi:MAG: error-prone DNA polymerase [Proteobacteria bacterium]|nr:error-prone DNA polymerase [Pseudomonadota bacterium]